MRKGKSAGDLEEESTGTEAPKEEPHVACLREKRLVVSVKEKCKPQEKAWILFHV
jgi:hypothetical protein